MTGGTPLTIGVFGTWGRGKTSLMHMLEEQTKTQGAVTGWFDVWKYDGWFLRAWARKGGSGWANGLCLLLLYLGCDLRLPVHRPAPTTSPDSADNAPANCDR